MRVLFKKLGAKIVRFAEWQNCGLIWIRWEFEPFARMFCTDGCLTAAILCYIVIPSILNFFAFLEVGSVLTRSSFPLRCWSMKKTTSFSALNGFNLSTKPLVCASHTLKHIHWTTDILFHLSRISQGNGYLCFENSLCSHTSNNINWHHMQAHALCNHIHMSIHSVEVFDFLWFTLNG